MTGAKAMEPVGGVAFGGESGDIGETDFTFLQQLAGGYVSIGFPGGSLPLAWL
jgi:hypothetical protein